MTVLVRIATTYKHANGNKDLIMLFCARRDMNLMGTGIVYTISLCHSMLSLFSVFILSALENKR